MKKWISLGLALALLLNLAGCGGKEASSAPSQEPVTLRWYVNFSWYNTPFGGNAVSRCITEATGTAIEFVSPGGTESVTLDTLIAGDDLPDLITLGWWEPQLQKIVDGGMVYPLGELADEYCPAFWEAATPERLGWYTQDDGNVYCYPNSHYSPQDYENDPCISSNQTFLVRKDIYEAIGSPDMTTPEGFSQAVRDAAARFPTVDGKPLIPIGAHEFTERGCDSFDLFLMNFLAVPYEKDGLIYDRYTDPDYVRWLKMFRRLGEEGYLKSDIFLDKRAQMEEKLLEGRYFCMLYQRTDLAEQQLYRCSQDPGSVYIAVDGPRNAAGDPHELPSSGLNGWTVTLISKNCKNPGKAISLMTYLMSREGQMLTSLGVEGENYTMENGKAVLTPETARLMREDYAAYVSQVGADNSYWMLQDNRMMDQWAPEPEPVLRQMRDWARPYTVFTGQYDHNFVTGSPADIAYQKLMAIHGRMLPQLLLAPTEEAFDELWDQYVQARKDCGLELVIAEHTRQMEQAKRKLGFQ